MRIPPSLFDVLTGLSDALRGETRSYENGVLVASSRESFDAATTNAVVVSWAADGGVSTNVLRFGRTLETVSPEGRTLVFHDSYGYPYLTQRSSPTGTSLDYATYAYRNLLGDLLEDGEYTLKTGSSTSSHWKYRHQGYDARGNPAVSTNELGETVLRSYDARRNLVGELGDTYPVRYGCDSAGRRIRMETTRDGGTTWDETRWTYDPATGNLLLKIFADGSVETHTYTADGLPLRTTFPGGRWIENRYDGNRRLAGVSSDDPSCEAEYAYDSFGAILSASGPLADAFNICYSTKYYDAESDLYYYGYRYYAPSLHRWLTRDFGSDCDERNLYCFIENHAIVDVDDLGLAPIKKKSTPWKLVDTVNELHVWHCIEWTTLTDKSSCGRTDKYIEHFKKYTFAKHIPVPSRYVGLLANGIVSSLEMDKDKSSAWCLDLVPISLYKRLVSGVDYYKIRFAVRKMDKHPSLKTKPEIAIDKFVGKTLEYNPYGK